MMLVRYPRPGPHASLVSGTAGSGAALGWLQRSEVAEGEVRSAIAATQRAYLDEAATLLGVPREAAGRLLAAPK